MAKQIGLVVYKYIELVIKSVNNGSVLMYCFSVMQQRFLIRAFGTNTRISEECHPYVAQHQDIVPVHTHLTESGLPRLYPRFRM